MAARNELRGERAPHVTGGAGDRDLALGGGHELRRIADPVSLTR
jgi:hypothetical protein